MRRSTATTGLLEGVTGPSLLELMIQKPMEKISIEEMTAKADVGRSTYFRYFKTKDEVLVFKILCLWNRFSEKSHITGYQADLSRVMHTFFEFCLNIRDINDILYRTGHQKVLLDVYLKTLVSGKQEEDITTYYKQNGTAYALYGIVNAWILRGYKESPEQMVETLGKKSITLN